MLRDRSFRRCGVISGAPAELRGPLLEHRSSFGFRGLRTYAIVSRTASAQAVSEFAARARTFVASSIQSLDPRPCQHQGEHISERSRGRGSGSKPRNDPPSAGGRSVLFHHRHRDRAGLRPRALSLFSGRPGGRARGGCCISLQFVSVNSCAAAFTASTGGRWLFHLALVFAAFVPAITRGFAGFFVGFLQKDG